MNEQAEKPVDQPLTDLDLSSESLTIKRNLTGMTAKIIYWIAVATSLFHLWVNTIGIMPEIQRNAVHYGLILLMGYVIYPLSKRQPSRTFTFDVFLGILSFAVALYLVFFEDALHARNEVPLMIDLVAAAVALVLMIEITRRSAGYLIPVLSILFISYALFLGKYLSGLWNFPGITVERLLYRMYFAPDGIFGTVASISSTFVFLFVLFASFLLKSGAGDFILRLATSLMGRTVGGPAKMAVFGSGLMGSVSGSAVANVVGTGSMTIPMMIKTGFKPKFAGGVEAAASTGGQLMPPIMGAGAFIMAQWTQISYLHIVAVSFIPAIMYFLSVAFIVHLEAQKMGLKPMEKADIPRFWEVMKEGWNFFLSIVVLMAFLLMDYTPTYSACAGIAAIVVSSWFNKKTRMGFKDILDALADGAKNMVTTAVILLCAGIIIGIVLIVAMGIKFSMIITDISGGSLFITICFILIAALILGMGLPVTASYITLAVLAAPAMTQLGAGLLNSHLLIFWFSQFANVTPPICLAAYTAAGIAGSRPFETGMQGWKLASGIYFIPLLIVYSPILFEGSAVAAIEVTLTGLCGLFSFAILLEGFYRKKVNIFLRPFFGVAAAMMFWPEMVTDLLGVALCAVLLAIHFLTGRKSSGQAAMEKTG
ncbi:MAG: TRAP transporter permease [Deltaproteobacteria bacterium]|nr:TRAP transporter permease [Deltaproteobacteria bacterium]